jgi:asparagine synthase (glutamine-hydrolysing)
MTSARPTKTPELNADGIDSYLRFGFIPTPQSAIENVRKLHPGYRCCIRLNNDDPQLEFGQYWSFPEVVINSRENKLAINLDQAATVIENKLRDSVSARMTADVPIGAFLSGGIDSSVIVALMQELSEKPVRTFTVGFEDEKFDESGKAHLVADDLGTKHTRFNVTPEEAWTAVEDIATVYDEPFADPSQIPTLLLSRLAQDEVKVVLTGDGGDELFGGYTRHLYADTFLRSIRLMPGAIQRLIGKIGTSIMPQLFSILPQRIQSKAGTDSPKRTIQKFFEHLADDNSMDPYERVLCRPGIPATAVNGAERTGVLVERNGLPPNLGPSEEMMSLDTIFYLPDDVLVKVDRATMAVGLESRAPFLDPNIVSTAWRLPIKTKINGGQGKRVLRRILSRRLSNSIVNQQKSGFDVPVGDWLRGPLKQRVDETLNPDRIREAGIFDPDWVETVWIDHREGRQDNGLLVWSILIFQLWWEQRGYGE